MEYIKENSACTCNATSPKGQSRHNANTFNNLFGGCGCLLIVIFFLGSMTSNIFKSNEEDTISVENYNKANAWLINNYNEFYNGNTFYVKKIENDLGKIIVNLYLEEPNMVDAVKNHARSKDFYIKNVCPNELETELWSYVKPSQIMVVVYDNSDPRDYPSVIARGVCSQYVTKTNDN